MNTLTRLHFFLIFLIPNFFLVTPLSAQSRFTSYDDLPGLVKSYKPSYEDNFPGWAKKLYSPDINFIELNEEFEAYMAENSEEESAIIRYYKNWRRAVADFVQEDGTIALPDIEIYYGNLKDQQMNPATLTFATSLPFSNHKLYGFLDSVFALPGSDEQVRI